jgi:hypothetical protein
MPVIALYLKAILHRSETISLFQLCLHNGRICDDIGSTVDWRFLGVLTNLLCPVDHPLNCPTVNRNEEHPYILTEDWRSL